MKTEFLICLLAAAGLHAGLMFLNTGSGPDRPMEAMIEVGLEHGVENAAAESHPSLQKPDPAPVPEQPVPPSQPKRNAEPDPQESVQKPLMPEKSKEPSADAPPPPAPSPPAQNVPPSDVPRKPVNTGRPAPARLGDGGDAENVSSVRYRQRASLSYPMSALRQKIGGTVELLVEIDAGGRATRVTVRQSSGQPDLDAAAIRCAQTSTYEPYRVNGIARPCRVIAPFAFKAP